MRLQLVLCSELFRNSNHSMESGFQVYNATTPIHIYPITTWQAPETNNAFRGIQFGKNKSMIVPTIDNTPLDTKHMLMFNLPLIVFTTMKIVMTTLHSTNIHNDQSPHAWASLTPCRSPVVEKMMIPTKSRVRVHSPNSWHVIFMDFFVVRLSTRLEHD